MITGEFDDQLAVGKYVSEHPGGGRYRVVTQITKVQHQRVKGTVVESDCPWLRVGHTEHFITFDKIDGVWTERGDSQADNMIHNAVGESANVSRRCFEAPLPKPYEEPPYCAGVGEFIPYSQVRGPRDQNGRLIREKTMGEEEAAVWLWCLAAAWPSEPTLPGWPCPIEWIFSPVTGNKQWPGDLWGVDETGELVLVEGKLGVGGDPFEDFAEPGFLPRGLHRREFTAEELRQKWTRHLHAELHGWSNSWQERPEGRKDGIIPRSSRRILNRRWRPLTDATRRRLESEEYRERVNLYLNAREGRKNPKPHFAGLHLCPDDQPPSMSACGEELARRVGKDHVHLFLAYGKRVNQSTAQCCIDLALLEAKSRVIYKTDRGSRTPLAPSICQ